VTNPLVALPVWLATYYTWHVPAFYDFALRRPSSVLHLEHLSYLLAGCLVWWPVVHDVPRRISDGARAVYLFAAFALASPLGLLLALIPRPVYSFYEHAPRIWGLSPLADQQLAGATMAAEQAIVFFCAFAFFLLRFLEEGEPYSAASSARTSSTPARQTSSTSSSGR
jgi:cytochrome c oxidase assembly factor CtaG